MDATINHPAKFCGICKYYVDGKCLHHDGSVLFTDTCSDYETGGSCD